MALAPFFRIGGLMTKEEHEGLTMQHELILSGVNEKDGMVEKFERLWTWYQQNKGRNAVIANIKDILISGGLLAIFITWLMN